MKELVSIISKIMNKEIIVKKSKIRIRTKTSEVDLLKSNSKKIKKIIKWKPNYSGRKGLIKGLEKTVKWFLENPYKDSKGKYII